MQAPSAFPLCATRRGPSARRHGREIVEQYNLSTLKALITAGEPATPDAWHWVFEVVGKRQLPLINISGGTEIGCSIITGTVIHPLKPCAFNGPALGSGAAVLDDQGKPVRPGERHSSSTLKTRMPELL